MNIDTDEIVGRVVRRTMERGGATYSLHSREFLEPVDAWYYPRHPRLTLIVPQDDLAIRLGHFMAEHQALLEEENVYLGTWINTETGKCYIDITTSQTDKDRAIAHAQHLSYQQGRQILEIYNPFQDQSVEV